MSDTIDTPKYTGPERRHRRGDDPITLDDLDEALEIHAVKEREYVKQMLDTVMRAFPNGDVLGHCEYHESKIQAAKAEEEFWKVAKEEATKRGIGAIFVVLKWVAILALLGFAYKIGFGPVIAKALGVTIS